MEAQTEVVLCRFWSCGVVFGCVELRCVDLMVMSQAAGIVQSYGGGALFSIGATSFITGMIASARITGGWLMDHFSLRQVMGAAHLWSLAGALMLTLWPSPYTALIALAMVGMGYGFVSGSAAGGISMHWPATQFGLVTSRLYIGWCIAAICLPVLAGWLFDWTGSYRSSIWIAAVVNAIGILLATRLPSTVRLIESNICISDE